jgi:hypothetical protein
MAFPWTNCGVATTGIADQVSWLWNNPSELVLVLHTQST